MTLILFLTAARWIHFAAIYLLFGMPFFWLWEAKACDPEEVPQAFRRSVGLLRIAAPVALLSGVAWIAGIVANVGGGFRDLGNLQILHLFFFETQFGALSALRLVLLALVVFIGMMPMLPRIRFPLLTVVAAMLLVSQAWLGHAAEDGGGLYGMSMVFAYSVHVLAGSAWVGGLVPLVFVLAELRSLNPRDADERALRILSRYSLMAIGAVALVAGTGIANAAFRVGGDFEKLFMTAYGAILGVKLLMVAVMLALAYFNRFVAMPKLRSAAKGTAQIATLRACVAAEWGVGLLVLGIAALLGITPPPQ